MNICGIMKADCANGPGIRVSLFVSGCTNHCTGCFNPETWDFEYGIPWTGELEDFLFRELSKTHYSGLTILGGEPFEFVNQDALLPLVLRVRKELPQKSIWIYTGFVYDVDLIRGGKRYGPNTDMLLNSIDVLVDGRFEQSRKNIALPFRGSENQRIIDMRRSHQEGHIITIEM